MYCQTNRHVVIHVSSTTMWSPFFQELPYVGFKLSTLGKHSRQALYQLSYLFMSYQFLLGAAGKEGGV